MPKLISPWSKAVEEILQETGTQKYSLSWEIGIFFKKIDFKHSLMKFLWGRGSASVYTMTSYAMWKEASHLQKLENPRGFLGKEERLATKWQLNAEDEGNKSLQPDPNLDPHRPVPKARSPSCAGNMFQDPKGMAETSESTESYIYDVFSYTYLPTIKINL